MTTGNTRIAGTDTAVILHLFYDEMWSSLVPLLRNIGNAIDLFVSIPADRDSAKSMVLSEFPGATILSSENRGRDIAPFLTVLPEISRAGYRYVCKLHTKRSRHAGYGGKWRDEMFDRLVGTTAAVARARDAFDQNPDWGLIAPAGHVVPHLYYWRANAERVEALARSVGIVSTSLDFNFVAGSMFWFRPEALSLVEDLGLRTLDFEPEHRQKDGTLAHAVERFIGLAVQRAGFVLAESDDEGVRPASISFHFRRLVEDLSGESSEPMVPAAAAEAESESIRSLAGRHAGETAWIVGKGPSLVTLTTDQLGPGPIIAINEATRLVEALGFEGPVYSLQKDADEYEYLPGPTVVRMGTEPIAALRRATLLVHTHESRHRMPEYRPRYVFDNVADFGLDWWEFSSLVAAAIARLLGCRRVVFVAHDACVTGDRRTCTPLEGGNFRIEMDQRSGPNYVHHRSRLEGFLSDAAIEIGWLTPESEASARADARRLVAGLHQEVEALRIARDEDARIAWELRTEVAESLRAIEVLRADVGAARDAAAQSDRRADAVAEDLAWADRRLHAMTSSRSWRWTRPLRVLLAWLMRPGPGPTGQ